MSELPDRDRGDESPGTDREPAGDSEAETLIERVRQASQHGVELDADDDAGSSPPADGAGHAGPSPAAIADRYAVRGEIGRGGMGAVFRVRDQSLRRSLAMKVLLSGSPRSGSPAQGVSDDRLDRFLEEAQVTAQLAHPGVVPVHELGFDRDGRVYFTMSLVRGSTLTEIIKKSRAGEDGWSTSRALQVVVRVCETMAFAHSKGVMHRDLKPSNVMVGKFGQTYVMDWGLAKVLGRPDSHDIRLRDVDRSTFSVIETRRGDTPGLDSPIMTMDGAVVGTPAYMSPEQAEGRVDEVDKRSDVYAIGALLYELLTGSAPYLRVGSNMSPYAVLAAVSMGPPRPVHEVDPSVPEELQAICEKAMSRDRAARYPSAEELAEDLQRFLGGHVVRAHKTGALIEMRKWVSRNRGVAATALAAVVVLAVVTGTLMQSLASERDRAVDAELAERDRAAAETRERERAEAAEQDALAASEREAARAAEAEDARETTANALRRMRALALAQRAKIVGTTKPMRRLLLAREAARTALLPETISKLHSAILVPEELGYLTHGEGDGMLLNSTEVQSVAFSEDGKTVLTASRDGTARLWKPDGSEIAVLRGHEGGVNTAEFTPDESRVVTASDDGTARVWDLEGNELAVLKGHEDWVYSCRSSADGQLLATASRDGTARLWRLDGTSVAELTAHEGRVHSARFCKDAPRLVTASADGTARIWDHAGNEVAVLEGHAGPVTDAAYSPRGKWIVTVSDDDTARVWDSDGKPVATLEGHGDDLTMASFSADEQRVVTASEDGTARIWNLAGNNLVILSGHESWVTSAVFSRDGKRVLTGSADDSSRLWDLDGNVVGVYLHERENVDPTTFVRGRVNSAIFAPNGRSFAAAMRDGSVRFWRVAVAEVALLRGDMVPFGSQNQRPRYTPNADHVLTVGGSSVGVWTPEGKLVTVLRGHADNVVSADFSPDGQYIVTSSRDATARLWTLDGTELAVMKGHKSGVSHVEISPDGERILTAGWDGDARVWSMEGEELVYLHAHYGFALANFAGDSRRVITGSGMASNVFVWPEDGGKPVFLKGHTDGTLSLAPAPDGVHVATASNDGTARVWTLGGESVATLAGHTDAVMVASFSADSQFVVTGSKDGTARVWRRTGEEVGVLRGHEALVFSVEFSPDGRHVLTASEDGTARVWTPSGELEFVLRDPGPGRATYSPDGRYIYGETGSHVRVWFADPADLLALADERCTREFTEEELALYRQLLSDDGTQSAVSPSSDDR